MAGVIGYEDEPWQGFYDKPAPVPESALSRVGGSAVKGASLGLLRSDLQPEGFVEKGAELLGSFAPIAGISAVASPFVGAGLRAVGGAVPFAAPLATRIAASPTATKALTSAVTGAVAGTVEGVAQGEGPSGIAAKAGEEALAYGATEVGLIKGWAGLKKLKALSTGEAAVIDKAVTTSVTTPTSKAADLATTMVPETPTIPAAPQAPTPGAKPKVPVAPTQVGDPMVSPGGMQNAKFGPSVAANSFGDTNGRITLDQYISSPEGPRGVVKSISQAASIREGFNRRFTPAIMKSAEDMTVEDFTKMAQSDAVTKSLMDEAKVVPEQVWHAAQLTKGVGETVSTVTGGKTPMFDEIFDETLGQKVLVPRNMEVARIVDTLKRTPEMRQVELQFDPEQLGWFKTKEGQRLLNSLDVVSQRKGRLTSDLVKLPEEEVDRIVKEGVPLQVINPTVIEKSSIADAISQARQRMGITDGEMQGIVQALAKQHEGDTKGFQEALERVVATRCAG